MQKFEKLTGIQKNSAASLRESCWRFFACTMTEEGNFMSFCHKHQRQSKQDQTDRTCVDVSGAGLFYVSLFYFVGLILPMVSCSTRYELCTCTVKQSHSYCSQLICYKYLRWLVISDSPYMMGKTDLTNEEKGLTFFLTNEEHGLTAKWEIHSSILLKWMNLSVIFLVR